MAILPNLTSENDFRLRKLIRYCFAFSLIFHLLAAWFSVGFHLYDEHFAILEFSGWKLGITPQNALSWEFPARIRPALQPSLVILIMKALGPNANPFVCSFLLRLFSSLLNFGGLLLLLQIGLKWLKTYEAKRFLVLASTLLWFFPYLHARYSAESISGCLFFLGVVSIWQGNELKKNYLLGLAGFLMGLAFVCRLQTGLMIFGVLIWCLFVARFSFKRLLWFGAPAILAIIIGILLDRWFYNEWVITAWNYFRINIIEGKASKEFGTSPWWTYFSWEVVDMLPPFSIFCMAGILYAFYKFPKNIVSLSFIPFLLVHIILGHKESRFLFPLANGVPVLLALSYDNIYDRFIKGRKFWPVFMKFFWGANILVLVISSLKPASDQFQFYQYIYDNYNGKAATLVSAEKHPYRLVDFHIYFHQPKDLTLVENAGNHEIDSFISSKKRPLLVVFYNQKSADDFFTRHQKDAKFVYSNIPEWMYKVNITDWISRTRMYRLYEIK